MGPPSTTSCSRSQRVRCAACSSSAARRRPRSRRWFPSSVRDEAAPTGNAVSFVFIDLPCDEPDPLRRLRDVQMAMADRKRVASRPAGAHSSTASATHRTACSTRSTATWPVPPPSTSWCRKSPARASAYTCRAARGGGLPERRVERHALSSEFTTMVDRAFFGVYADRRWVPDPGVVTRAIEREMRRCWRGVG